MRTSEQSTKRNGGAITWMLGIWAIVATLVLAGLFHGGYINLLHNDSTIRIGDLSQTINTMAQNIHVSETGLAAMSQNIASLSDESEKSAVQLSSLFKDADSVSKGLALALSNMAQNPELTAQIADSGLSDAQVRQVQEYYSYYATPSMWPNNVSEREKKREETAEFFNSLSDGQKILVYTSPDFQRMSWSHEVMIATDSVPGDDAERLEQRITALAAVMDAAPENVSPEAYSYGESHIAALNEAASAQRRATAHENANAALAENANVDAAFAGLLEFDDADSVTLREHLQVKVRENEILGEVERFKSDYETLTRREESDPLRNMGVARVYQAVSDLSLSSSDLQDGAAKDSLSAFQNAMQKVVDDIAKNQREEEQRKYNDYQVWTLLQIEKWETYDVDSVSESFAKDVESFNPKNLSRPTEWKLFVEFPSTIEQNVKELYNVTLNSRRHTNSFDAVMTEIYNGAYVIGAGMGRGFTGVSEIANAVHKEAMKKFLMMVDTRYLEPPVLALFNQAWNAGWEKLDVTGRLDIANASAEIEKKTL